MEAVFFMYFVPRLYSESCSGNWASCGHELAVRQLACNKGMRMEVEESIVLGVITRE
jgi:hypothetical protein